MKSVSSRKFQKGLLAGVIVVLFLILFWAINLLGSRIHTRSIPSGSISVSTNYSKYLIGEPVTFTISNNFNSTIYVNNNCPDEPLEVYKYQTDGTWVQVHDDTVTSECKDSDRQIVVAPNDSATGSYERWPNLFKEPGRYRVVAYVEFYNELPYQDFDIVAIPELSTPATTNNTSQASPSSSQSSNTNSSAQTNSAQPSTPQEIAASTRETVNVENAGSVVVDYTNSYITVLSISLNSGCNFEGGRSGTSVEITFKCGGSETQLQLSINNGKLVKKIEND